VVVVKPRSSSGSAPRRSRSLAAGAFGIFADSMAMSLRIVPGAFSNGASEIGGSASGGSEETLCDLDYLMIYL
jgi:hypothetical protein